MRKSIALASLTVLAACSGGGPESAGSGGVTGGASIGNASDHKFTSPTVKKTYSAIGAVQTYKYSTDDRAVGQYNQLYAGNASTARNSGVTISYDPRDAIFELTVADTLAGANDTIRFQDPAHRTNFGGTKEPQDGTPNVADLLPLGAASRNIQYLQVGSSDKVVYGPDSDTFPIGIASGTRDVSTFFYQKPGTTTQYVTYAGFVRNATAIVEIVNPDSTKYLQQNNTLERAAFVFGERTDNSAVPTTGTATYSGDMLATMVYNPQFDSGNTDTYFQWIVGSNTTNVNFGSNTLTTTLTGVVDAPQFDVYTGRQHELSQGATFNASAHGSIDLVNKGGFTGQFDSASFTQGGATQTVDIAGSSLDGAFYGPGGSAEKLEVGGGFRIVGGTPDQRIDIMGAFTGKK